MLRTALLFALSLSAGSALACDGPGGSCKMSEQANRVAAMTGEIPATATVAHYTVSGLDCGNCAKELRAALESTAGVQAALVDTTKGTLDVGYDPKKISVEKIAETVNTFEEGKYKATPNQS
jgi:copper chaperone CopZ